MGGPRGAKNISGVLAVYRVRTIDGRDVLKALKPWPGELAS